MQKYISFVSVIVFYILVAGSNVSSQKDPILDNLLPDPMECGVGGIHERIFFGKEADIGEFPWMARLEYITPQGRESLCGGVLISNQYVLTAAHCIYTGLRDTTLIRVILGEHDVEKRIDCRGGLCNDPVIEAKVDPNIMVHEQYERGKSFAFNDIAMIKLTEKVNFTDFIRPICLPKEDNDLAFSYYRNILFVAGWGTTENGTKSNVLLKAKIKPVSFEDCQAKFKRSAIVIKPVNLCAGGDSKQDSCRGDSGGPLMSVKVNEIGDPVYNVDGIVSYGFASCGVIGWPAIYTKVSDFMCWILENMMMNEMKNLIKYDTPQYCITPNFEMGKCKELRKCDYLLQFLKRKNLHPKVRTFLKNSQCGVENNQPIVCCYEPTAAVQSAGINFNPSKVSHYRIPQKPSCGLYNKAPNSDTDDFPWFVLLIYNNTVTNEREIFCSGVLINERYVLTAAHCIKTAKHHDLQTIRFGGYNVTKRYDVGIEKSIAHPDYDSRSKQNDIGIIKMAHDVKFTALIGPVCLPTDISTFKANTAEGRRMLLSVWKEDNAGDIQVIQYEIPVVSNSICDDVLLKKSLEVLSENQMCAGGEKYKDACVGDGGAPLMYTETDFYGRTNWYAAGLVSFGSWICGSEGIPSVYTSIYPYIPWIKSMMKYM